MLDRAWERWREDGDARCLDHLLRAELPRLLRRARQLCREDAEDAVQDGVLCLLNNRERLPDGLGFSAAAMTTVASAARMVRRARQRRQRRWVGLSDQVQPIGGEEDFLDESLLANLSAAERQLLERSNSCSSAAEAGAVFGLSGNAFQVRLHRLRRRLCAQARGSGYGEPG